MAVEGNIRAISRGLKVLQVINQHRALSMMEIARLCDLPYPTACRIVETLVEEQMIEREGPRKYYRPTALVRTLSVGYQDDNSLAEAARPHINELTRELRWPISVCTRVGMNTMIRACTHAIAPFTLNVYHPGYTMPLLGSSSGKVQVAFSSSDEQDSVINNVRRPEDADGDKFVTRLRALFGDIREKGYSSQDRIKHTANPGKTSAISVPIMRDDSCQGTLTLAFFASSLSLPRAVDSFLPKIKAAAGAIARDLPYRELHA